AEGNGVLCHPSPADPVTHEEFTISVTVVERVRLPLVPVIVSVNAPVGVVLDVETFSVDDPNPPLIDVGLNEPLGPLGSPLTLRLTVPVRPLIGLTLAV